ncbi:MAG: 4Fe-4S binding protein [Chloroflexi bacterium]|nr:4Fe-4S binding protein [Chloroflexota bacterium]
MASPIWFVRLLQRFFSQRFAIARLSKHSFVVRRFFDRVLFPGDHILYLPKNNVIQVHEAVQPPVSTVLPSQILEHFIDKADYHFVMNRCICREAAECQHYPVDLGCLFLGEAVKGIHPELGCRVSKAEALAHLKRAQQAGLVQMIGRNHLDTVWMGVGPGDKLMTICNCCECCCLYKMLPDMHETVSSRIQKMPGVSVSVGDACVGCGKCAQGVCFVNAIRLENGRAVIGEDCRGCGRCVEVCPTGAISLHVSGWDFVETSITQLEPLVNLKASLPDGGGVEKEAECPKLEWDSAVSKSQTWQR